MSRCREIKLRREEGDDLEGASLEIFLVFLPAGYLCVDPRVCRRNAGQARLQRVGDELDVMGAKKVK